LPRNAALLYVFLWGSPLAPPSPGRREPWPQRGQMENTCIRAHLPKLRVPAPTQWLRTWPQLQWVSGH
jgi:hypothetical protein